MAVNRAFFLALVLVSGPVFAQQPVDMGLSVQWGDRNVGAASPQEYGGFYAWGETMEKETYNWMTYRFCEGSPHRLSRYCPLALWGQVDSRTRLEAGDDVATCICGPGWRMPTSAEWESLLSSCDWSWSAPQQGYVVRSRTTGKEIFLPAGGFRIQGDHHYFGIDGLYWAADVVEDLPYDAYRVYFSNYFRYLSYAQRYFGFLVRPVYVPSIK